MFEPVGRAHFTTRNITMTKTEITNSMTSIEFCDQLNDIIAKLTGRTLEEQEDRDDAAMTAGSRTNITVQGVAWVERDLEEDLWIVRNADLHRHWDTVVCVCPLQAMRAVVKMFLNSYCGNY